MKVLMILPQFHPIVGGYERSAYRLIRALIQKGHTIQVITERRNRGWLKTEIIDDISVYRWPCKFIPKCHTITSLIGLVIALTKYGRSYDLWHVHQYGAHASVVFAIAKIFRRKVVLKLTNTDVDGISKALDRLPLSSLHKINHRQADVIIALTNEVMREALEFGFKPAVIQKVGNSIDVNAWPKASNTERDSCRSRLGLGSALTVVFCGRLVPQKNIEGLLDIWALAKKKMSSEWQLIVIGDGPSRDGLAELVEKSYTNASVKLIGQQNNISDWFLGADIFVSASFHEGLSNTLLEAMLSELPVVVFAVSGTEELVEATGAGFRLPIGDVTGMANALIQLSNKPDLRRSMGAKGGAYVRRFYSNESVANRYEEIYKRLL